MITPKKLMEDLVMKAIMSRLLSSSLQSKGKPGDFFKYIISTEERSILQSLKDSDLQNSFRPEWFC